MSRALATNAELSFEMTQELSLDAETTAILDDTEQLLEIRRGNMNQQEKKRAPTKAPPLPRIGRKLRFQKDISLDEQDEEDMDTN
jgi:hypothetical protein